MTSQKTTFPPMRVRHVKTGDLGTARGTLGGCALVEWDAGSYVKTGPIDFSQIEAVDALGDEFATSEKAIEATLAINSYLAGSKSEVR